MVGSCHNCGCPTHFISVEFGWAHENASDFQRCKKQGIPAEMLGMIKLEGYDRPVAW